MREFDKVLNMGNGDFSEIGCYRLHRRLEDGFSILSGLQQPDHSSSQKEADLSIVERRMSRKELEDVVRDIVTAFGFDLEEIDQDGNPI